ncbi:CDP-alcohol phosphatidyltransferase class-I family protein [Isoptericola aurantiacus]|uniref:hypothetical protein n=1 Tax=Isoptericola aurantiacus TaxID=3377839 RepID=UPI00383BF22E
MVRQRSLAATRDDAVGVMQLGTEFGLFGKPDEAQMSAALVRMVDDPDRLILFACDGTGKMLMKAVEEWACS